MLSYRSYHPRSFFALIIALVSVAILMLVLISQVQAASIYVLPDTLSNNPNYSMTVNNGKPILSYYSKDIGSIVVAICGNTSCETALTVIHPIETVLLEAVAVTIVNGNPLIAYSTLEYPSASHLRVAACIDPLCSQPPVITTLDTGDFWHMAITLQNGNALIAYENVSSGTDHNIVKLAICNNATCTAPIIRSLDITDGISGGNGLAVGLLNGNPIVAYRTWQGLSGVTLLKCASPTCAETPTLKLVDTNSTSNLAGIALVTTANTPIITYSTSVNGITWLKVATCTDVACDGSMYIHTVDVAAPGRPVSINLVNGLPVIAYVRQGIRLATCLDIVCNYSSSVLIEDSTHDYPIVDASQNLPVISFIQTWSASRRNLKIYFAGDFQPPQSPTPSPYNTLSTINMPTRTVTASSTMPMSTPTITPSITPTPSFTHTPTPTPTDTPTLTNTPTNTPTSTLTPTPTDTPTNTSTPTSTDTPVNTLTPTRITPTSALNSAPVVNFYTTHTPTLTWNAVSFATKYEIQISTDINFAPAATITAFADTTLTYTTGNLPNGTYYWRVRALNGTNTGNWSLTDAFVISA